MLLVNANRSKSFGMQPRLVTVKILRYGYTLDMRMEVGTRTFIFCYSLGLKDLAVNAFCDFALALFPISFIKNLQIRFSSKVILVVLMSCGVM